MNNSILKYLTQKSEAHAARASENQEVAKLFVGIVSRCVVECQDRGVPIEGVSFGDLAVDGWTIRTSVRFNNIALYRPAEFLSTQYADMGDYIQSKSAYLMVAMKKNPEFNRLIERILDTLQSACRTRGVNYRDLKVKRAFISNDGGVLVEFER